MAQKVYEVDVILHVKYLAIGVFDTDPNQFDSARTFAEEDACTRFPAPHPDPQFPSGVEIELCKATLVKDTGIVQP